MKCIIMYTDGTKFEHVSEAIDVFIEDDEVSISKFHIKTIDEVIEEISRIETTIPKDIIAGIELIDKKEGSRTFYEISKKHFNIDVTYGENIERIELKFGNGQSVIKPFVRPKPVVFNEVETEERNLMKERLFGFNGIQNNY